MSARKLFSRSLVFLFILAFAAACSSVKNIEMRADGGTMKYKKRGLAKESREDKAQQNADEHCKQNGFKTYKIESEVQDGRFTVMRFSCIN